MSFLKSFISSSGSSTPSDSSHCSSSDSVGRWFLQGRLDLHCALDFTQHTSYPDPDSNNSPITVTLTSPQHHQRLSLSMTPFKSQKDAKHTFTFSISMFYLPIKSIPLNHSAKVHNQSNTTQVSLKIQIPGKHRVSKSHSAEVHFTVDINQQQHMEVVSKRIELSSSSYKPHLSVDSYYTALDNDLTQNMGIDYDRTDQFKQIIASHPIPKEFENVVRSKSKSSGELSGLTLENDVVLDGSFVEKYPFVKDFKVLLVPGLFTQHYPGYFVRNLNWIRFGLGLNVEVIPIHTEESCEANGKFILDYIVEKCRDDENVVLMGHSKGCCDVLSCLMMSGDGDGVRQKVKGIVMMQGPLQGTYAAEWVEGHKALDKGTGAVGKMWGGSEACLRDMRYSAGKKRLGEFRKDGDLFGLGKELGDKMVCLMSCSAFGWRELGSVDGLVGTASMGVIAEAVEKHAGFLCDGLVIAHDARMPYSDVVLLDDMLHSHPALFVPKSKYDPAEITHAMLTLLCEKLSRTYDAFPVC